MLEHETARIVLAVLLVAMAGVILAWPDCMYGVNAAFSRRSLTPEARERLEHALDARRDAEDIATVKYSRYLAAAAIVCAGLEFVPALSLTIPYALFWVAIGITTFLAYLQFRRALERRVAPLARRSPFDALPVPAVVAMLCCLAAGIVFVALPGQRAAALLTVVATSLLVVTSWRIAIAPALLMGNDPQLEYAIDERLRRSRATNVAALACAPAVGLAAFAAALMPGEPAVSVTLWVVVVAWAVAMLTNALRPRRPLRFT